MNKLLASILLLPFFCIAEDNKPSQVFEVELAQDAPKVDKYALAEDGVFSLFSELKNTIDQALEGEIAAVKTDADPKKHGTVNDDFYTYLNSVYLYCSINNGTCPEVLNSLLEIDIINSKLKNKATCINMLKFWKSWLDNDMEKRHKHSTKITHINLANTFNKEERPKYTKCRKNIEGILAKSVDETAADFFKARYSTNELPKQDLIKTIALLEQIQEKIPDLYKEVGLK